MCSIGRHDGPDQAARPTRRRNDGTHSRMLRDTPRTELQKRRAAVIESLRFSQETSEADALAEQHGQLELIPPDMAQLPRASFKTVKLPDPESLWYSAARET